MLVDRRPDVSVGQTAQLRTDSSSFEVRVVHLSEVPASEGENGSNPEGPELSSGSVWFAWASNCRSTKGQRR